MTRPATLLPHPAIARAKPFVDQDFEDGLNPTGWRASTLLTILYCTLLTGRNPSRAAPALEEMLTEARNRYAAGFYANPFMEPVRPRPASRQ